MIGSLRGLLLDRALRPDHGAELLVEVGGVGYRVLVPSGVVAGAGELGGQVFLHVHTHVREDALVLYGFQSREERDCFELLLAAHGVGPGLAVALLSALSPSSLRRAVQEEDLDALMAVPGIGRKTAARLVIDLASKLDALPAVPGAWPGGVGGAAGAPGSVPHEASAADRSALRDEVKSALVSLGYSAEEVRLVLARLPGEGSAEDLLRDALRQLAGRP